MWVLLPVLSSAGGAASRQTAGISQSARLAGLVMAQVSRWMKLKYENELSSDFWRKWR